MAQKSSIVLVDLSCIDHAYLSDETFGRIHGGSFMASFTVTGDLDEQEQVVEDFSSVKKIIKSIIDHPEYGFDHKLWVFPNAWDYFKVSGIEERLTLRNPRITADVPFHAVKVFPESFGSRYSEALLEQFIGDEVTKKLSYMLDRQVTVTCSLSPKPVLLPNTSASCVALFSYTHGLKNSSSVACRNPLHGHLSYLQLIKNPHTLDAWDSECSQSIASLLSSFSTEVSGKAIVFSENVTERSETDAGEHFVRVEYEVEQGQYSVMYNEDDIIELDVETTVENLAEHLVAKFIRPDELRDLGITSYVLSEGLTKGALITH